MEKKICIIFKKNIFQVKGRDVGFQTTKEGEFWRIILPGIYTMEVFAEGYQPREVQFAIVEQNLTLFNEDTHRIEQEPVSLKDTFGEQEILEDTLEDKLDEGTEDEEEDDDKIFG